MKAFLLAATVLLTPMFVSAEDAVPTKFSAAFPPDFVSAATIVKVDRKAFVQSRTPMTFGSYEIVDHHAGFRSSRESGSSVLPPYIPTDLPTIDATAKKWKQSFRFALARDGKPQWGCLCRATGSSEGYSTRSVDIQTHAEEDLTCKLISALDMNDTSLFTLHGYQAGKFGFGGVRVQGQVASGEATVEIAPVYDINGTLPKFLQNKVPFGFTIRSNDEIVAAVDTSAHPLVYFARSLNDEDQSFYAAVAAALLLYYR